MTREEIIEMLKVLKEQALSSCNDTVVIDVKKDSFIFVINMAIEALEQEPCEDCISRKDLIKSKFIIPENEYEKTWNDVLDSLYENAPSVHPKPKTDVLDKIRAEIEAEPYVSKMEVLDIIDRYKAESEDKYITERSDK